ncbi:MAG: hypothetical protein Q4F79_00795 [Eubacteriales bacterium]|nr:hypothetical protein [Eubacteriales bacterium]
MENKSFFRTKEGGLTIAFLVIMIAFAIIIAGLGAGSEAACMAGFVLIVVAMLYSPVKVQIYDRIRKNK